MDINEKINEIIFKYQLDCVYPHYRNMYEAEKILRNTIRGIIQRNSKAVFVGNDKTGIEFIRKISRDYSGISFLFYDWDKLKLSQLENIDWSEYEEIYLISFYGAEYVERWFRMHNVQYYWIYDIFEQGGAFLQREFFAFGKEDLFSLIVPTNGQHTRNGWTESLYGELYAQKNKYENTDDYQTQYISLKKCLFLTLYMRNFVAAQRYVNLLAQYDKQFDNLWKEIQELLHVLRETVSERTDKDIVCYWIDSLPYGDESDMLYLQQMSKDSIVFENVFTYVSQTHPTLRAMFLGKKDIDDFAYQVKEISQENSPLMRLMEEQGYSIKVISAYFLDLFSYSYLTSQFYVNWFESASLVLWDMVSNMFAEERKTLWVVHIMDTHSPYLNTRISDDNYGVEDEQYKSARMEVDEQLAFYESFLNKDVTRIYMSDHGQQEGLNRFHVLFNIYQRKWKPKKVDGMVSLLDFSAILKQIVVDGHIKEEGFVKEHVEIGYLDLYSYYRLAQVFRNRAPLSSRFFGYKGVVDKEYVYIRYKTGREWLQKRNSLPICDPLLFCECEEDICEPWLLPKYREMTGGYPPGFNENFKYSEYLYTLYDRILKHNNMAERVDMINQMLEKYPVGSVGIRTGGKHSAVLYYILTNENKRKIWGFIDDNANCECSKLHLPIISPEQTEQLEENGVKAVVLSSYGYRNILRKEAENLPENIDVLDIYEYFDRNGIRYEGSFYIVKGTDEDYAMVDFPFVES